MENKEINIKDSKGNFISENKTPKDLHQFITLFLNEKSADLYEIWDNLEDKDKASFFLHLSKLIKPIEKLEAEVQPEEKHLTPQEAKEFIRKLEEEI